jgi:hypothetical protein
MLYLDKYIWQPSTYQSENWRVPRPTNNTIFGMELEFGPSSERHIKAAKLLNLYYMPCKIYGDTGGEIAMSPMTIEQLTKWKPQLSRFLHSLQRSEIHDGTGLHISVSSARLDAVKYKRMGAIMNKIRVSDMNDIFGRPDGQYHTQATAEIYNDTLSSDRYRTRYRTDRNNRHCKAIELRVWKSTTDYDELMKAIKQADALASIAIDTVDEGASIADAVVRYKSIATSIRNS